MVGRHAKTFHIQQPTHHAGGVELAVSFKNKREVTASGKDMASALFCGDFHIHAS